MQPHIAFSQQTAKSSCICLLDIFFKSLLNSDYSSAIFGIAKRKIMTKRMRKTIAQCLMLCMQKVPVQSLAFSRIRKHFWLKICKVVDYYQNVMHYINTRGKAIIIFGWQFDAANYSCSRQARTFQKSTS